MGQDVLGGTNSRKEWTSIGTHFVTSVRNYAALDSAVFTYKFPDGANDTAHQPVTGGRGL